MASGNSPGISVQATQTRAASSATLATHASKLFCHGIHPQTSQKGMILATFNIPKTLVNVRENELLLHVEPVLGDVFLAGLSPTGPIVHCRSQGSGVAQF
jgi:purine nucleoside permease